MKFRDDYVRADGDLANIAQPLAAETTEVRAARGVSACERQDAELRDDPGVVGDLMNLAKTIRNAAATVSRAVEHVALGLDEERRGFQSCMGRRDEVALARGIEDLLANTLLTSEANEYLVDRLGAMMDEVRARRPTPAARPEALNHGREGGRRVARAIGIPIPERSESRSETRSTAKERAPRSRARAKGTR